MVKLHSKIIFMDLVLIIAIVRQYIIVMMLMLFSFIRTERTSVFLMFRNVTKISFNPIRYTFIKINSLEVTFRLYD
jgi:hypothetical protein